MAETTEKVRKDSAVREQKQKEKSAWSGRTFAAPRGTTLPAVGNDRLPGEIFILEKSGSPDQFYIYDDDVGGGNPNWVTVGP